MAEYLKPSVHSAVEAVELLHGAADLSFGDAPKGKLVRSVWNLGSAAERASWGFTALAGAINPSDIPADDWDWTED